MSARRTRRAAPAILVLVLSVLALHRDTTAQSGYRMPAPEIVATFDSPTLRLHGYAARETHLHLIAEKIAWFDKYVKGAAPRTTTEHRQ